MISSYPDYLKAMHALTIEEMASLHGQMIDAIGTDEEALDLYRDLIECAGRYSQIRTGWYNLTFEEKADQDNGRTGCHNAFIVHLNVLARYLGKQGKSTSWRDDLGDENDPWIRKAIGDFACYLAFVTALGER